MKIWLALLLLVPTLAWANPWTYRVDTSSVNLAATFPGSPQLTGPHQILNVQIDNQTASEIEVNCSRGSSAPSSNSADSVYVAGNTTWSSPDNTSLGSTCFVRSVSGTVSSGIFRVTAWGW